jgi:hypothetical protein
MRWTQESLVKARGIVMVVVGVLILIAYLISRLSEAQEAPWRYTTGGFVASPARGQLGSDQCVWQWVPICANPFLQRHGMREEIRPSVTLERPMTTEPTEKETAA